jgi:hypothetical protein
MFESFKSAKILEKELRAWLVNDTVRILGEPERNNAAELANSKDERELVAEVMSLSLSLRADQKNDWMATGKVAPFSEVLRCIKGNKLAHAFAKAKGWELVCEGSQAFGYTCHIK